MRMIKNESLYHGEAVSGEIMYSYCLFCETQKCRALARELQRVFGYTVIAPRTVQHTWSAGAMTDREHDLLPGYLFLYTEDLIEDLRPLRRFSGVLRILGEKDDGYLLKGRDEQFALALLSLGGVVGKTRVYKEGQKIKLADDAFQGIEAKILKASHRNRRLQIELPFAGMLVKTWVEYEMVKTDIREELDTAGRPESTT